MQRASHECKSARGLIFKSDELNTEACKVGPILPCPHTRNRTTLSSASKSYILDRNIHSKAKLLQATVLYPVFSSHDKHDASQLLKRFTPSAVSFYLAQESQEQATVVNSIYITDTFMTYSTECLNR